MAKVRGGSRLKRGDGEKREPKKAPPPRKQEPPPLPGAMPAVCSECFGDFAISTTPRKDNITCPSCGHVGIIEEGAMEKIAKQRADHHKSFLIALVVACLAFILIAAFGIANSWPLAVEQNAKTGALAVVPGDEAINMVLLGLGAVLLMGGLFMIAKYEKSRVEVYF